MFGTLRLILASLVAIGHTGKTFFGVNLGICAVTMFFMISGYVTTGLLRKKFVDARSVPRFYADRLFRIYPQFLFFYLLYVLFFEYSGFQGAGYPIDHFTIKNFLLSIAIVPLDWAVLTGNVFHIFSSFGGLTQYILMHPAWSLGLEIQFYFLLPFILFGRIRPIVAVASSALFSLAAFSIVNQQVYGYFFIPGVLFIFLSGSLMYDYNDDNKRSGLLLLLVYAFTVVLYIVCGHAGKFATYNRAVLLGLLFGIPIIFALSRLKRHALDEWLGNVSYGVFLCHVLVIDVAQNYNLFVAGESLGKYLACVFVAGALGYQFVERPTNALRKRLRARTANRSPVASTVLAAQSPGLAGEPESDTAGDGAALRKLR